MEGFNLNYGDKKKLSLENAKHVHNPPKKYLIPLCNGKVPRQLVNDYPHWIIQRLIYRLNFPCHVYSSMNRTKTGEKQLSS